MLRLASSPILQRIVKPPLFRAVHIKPGFLTSQVKARMAQPILRDRSPSQESGHIVKKPRLQLDADDSLTVTSQTGTTIGVETSNPKPKEPRPQSNKQRKKASRKRKNKRELPEPCSAEDVISRDVAALLGAEVEKAVHEGSDWDSPLELQTELEVVVSELSSSGDSLSLAPAPHKPWVVLTPLALPGERIRVRIYYNSRLYSRADLLEVIEPNNELRDMSRVKCKYFGECGGCQYQMLSYEKQLDLKRNVVVKAYKNFSGLPESSVPEIQTTIGSPLQYNYRTKITPHFELSKKRKDEVKIGFNKVNTKFPIDIEECPIATEVINKEYGPLRERVYQNIATYKRGASLLLRESLKIPSKSTSPSPDQEATDSQPEEKICVTNHKDTVRERVGDMLFQYGASSFFQNNNSILVPLTSYVRDAIFPSSSSSTQQKPTHLVDAYCGSGLFALALSSHFDKIAGIELSNESIKAAKFNATLNNLAPSKCSFLEGDAANIFDTVQSYPRDQTAVIIDPPRKGSDEKFIDQLIDFGSSTVVYVSCNVHTQARDVGMILRKSREKMGGKEYVVESIRGFDLFPQTSHVESVAVLRLVDSSSSGEVEMQS